MKNCKHRLYSVWFCFKSILWIIKAVGLGYAKWYSLKGIVVPWAITQPSFPPVHSLTVPQSPVLSNHNFKWIWMPDLHIPPLLVSQRIHGETNLFQGIFPPPLNCVISRCIIGFVAQSLFGGELSLFTPAHIHYLCKLWPSVQPITSTVWAGSKDLFPKPSFCFLSPIGLFGGCVCTAQRSNHLQRDVHPERDVLHLTFSKVKDNDGEDDLWPFDPPVLPPFVLEIILSISVKGLEKRSRITSRCWCVDAVDCLTAWPRQEACCMCV